MPSHKLIQIVAAESTPEKDAKFNKWYIDVHIPMLFGYKGVKEVNRYRVKMDDPKLAKYLTIYEFDSEEDLAGFTKSKAFTDAIADFEAKKDEINFISKWFGIYEHIKTWKK
jgi:hypothetical protein